eukprot:CAMPEP_0194127386 /NCGR_PEP_ID=MMETSP0150-20130528/60494_1 /TAXON_ID=122233 /ORGANISM="Chaetoceros debilis, Strain MM31A-1" /LENGTH=1501 /DNA_ID=CAMNT_0038821307 /DNA_START=204 /DNA_END=4709 /DNA_ORIENTATION=+
MRQTLRKFVLFSALYVLTFLPVCVQRVLAAASHDLELEVHSHSHSTTTRNYNNVDVDPSANLKTNASRSSAASSSSSAPDGNDNDNDKNNDNDNDGPLSPQDVIVVATLDGTFYGLSQYTGDLLWKSSHQEKYHQQQQQHSQHHSHSSTTTSHGHGHGHGMPPRPPKASGSGNSSGFSSDENIFSPLVSTTTTRSDSKTWRTAAVPSIDGRVYLTLGNTGINVGGEQEQEQSSDNNNDNDNSNSVKNIDTVHVKELVDRSPFMDMRGRMFVSNKRAYAVALSKETGEVLKVIKAGTGADAGTDNNNKNVKEQIFNNGPPLPVEEFIWVARVDYEVTVHDARTGEVDVQFSTSEVLSVGDMLQGGGGGSGMGGNHHRQHHIGEYKGHKYVPMLPTRDEVEIRMEEDNGRTRTRTGSTSFLPQAELEQSTNVVVSTPGGMIAFSNPDSGDIQWISKEIFDSPIAYAVESSTGASLGVQIVPDAPMPDQFSEDYLESELERQLQLSNEIPTMGNDGSSVFDNETVFGAMKNGELFAMPIGPRSNHGISRHGNILPHNINRLASSTTKSIGMGGGGTTIKLPAKIPGALGGPISIDSDWQKSKFELETITTDAANSRRKSSGTAGALLKAQTCDQSSPNFPECLIEIYREVLGDGKNKAFGKSELDALQLAGEIYKDLEKKNPKSRGKMWDILTSWLPPAVALLFVISFEFGRRERAKVDDSKKRDDMDDMAKMHQESSESVSLRRDLSDEALDTIQIEQPTGVIQVSEIILGYGGHGTVVYKGKLDGRFVAVKRMLKAYHASADREISLLIESDGHPNVVRYFLKEIRGDFVYLALELCDMNLQDLIVSLSKQRMKIASQQQDNDKIPTICTDVESPVRKMLLAVANGVKHIHSLRIVHRDLKPANILIAKSGRRAKSNSKTNQASKAVDEDGVVRTFEADRYIPKISDMGLGKQLAGQSSFGLSTFNTSLGPGVSGNEGSTIAGAGPGSVGWQAPEVMARRLSPESASLDGGSGPESYLMEASPMDISLSGKTSRSVDIFSLGCIFYCTLLPGSHPFGEWYEREANIMKNRPNTDALKDVSYDAWDLVCSMLSRNPKLRPTAAKICNHPFFWSSSQRIAFLCDFSDRMETDIDSNFGVRDFDRLLIERQASFVVGISWSSSIDKELLNNVQKFRTYDTSSVRDCLRLIRNKHHHFDELPLEFREKIAPDQVSLLRYFESKFPRLLMHCYNTCREHLQAGDPLGGKYKIPLTSILLKKKESSKPPTIVSSTSANNVSNAEKSTKSEWQLQASDKLEAFENTLVTNTPGDESSDCLSETQDQPPPVVSEPESDTKSQPLPFAATPTSVHEYTHEIIVWQGSATAASLNCRGWIRSPEDWVHRTNEKPTKRDVNLTRCSEDPKFRTRLCNHWDVSKGTKCPMLKKNKCVFAHGPAELRVKEAKRNRWGRLVDTQGNNSNPQHSGGEDTFGAARSIESARKVEGKWNTNSTPKKKSYGKNKKSPKKN